MREEINVMKEEWIREGGKQLKSKQVSERIERLEKGKVSNNLVITPLNVKPHDRDMLKEGVEYNI